MIVEGLTNKAFGAMVGCSESMASRIRHANRLPSLALLGRIMSTFDLPAMELMRAHAEGRDAFAAYIEERIFGHAKAA